MKKKQKAKGDLRREYDLAKLGHSVRGKYAGRYRTGTNLVLLSPDVAQFFRDEQSVNAALRDLMHVAKRTLKRSR